MHTEYDIHLAFETSKAGANKLASDAEGKGYDCELTYLLDEVKKLVESKIKGRVQWKK